MPKPFFLGMILGHVHTNSFLILGFVYGLFLLPSVDTTARFTQFPPSVLYVSSGGTARFVWDYHVDDKRLEFSSQSPVWSFLDKSGNERRIGFDDKYTNNWSFIIKRATCPPRLLNPDRVSREPTATLVITNVTTADNGIYQCSLKLRAGNPIDHQVQLVVTVRPIFLPSHLNKTYHIIIIEGQDLKINCSAIGPPVPNITWVNTTDGSVVIKSQGSGSAVLQIDDIRRYHAGIYECQAKNNPNEDATTTRTRVTVYYKPAILTSISTTGQQHSWNGKMTTLKCIAHGFPQPNVTWYKPNGQPISCGVKALSEGIQVTVRTTDRGADYGLYKCRAANVAGKDEHFIVFSQLFPPDPPKFTILDQDIQASSVNVRWVKPGYDGGSPVIGYKVQINTDPPQEKRTTSTHTYFYGLTKNTSYAIKVLAINVVGSGNLSQMAMTTKTQGKPAIPEITAVVLYSSRDSKLSIVLKWIKPDDNGGAIEKYSIYKKEIHSHNPWKKVDDITNPSSQLQYIANNDIVDGKSYMFIVTAWNKYGESAKDDKSAKVVNTKSDRALSETGTRTVGGQIQQSSQDTVVGVVSSLFVLSLGLNVLLFVLLWRRTNKSGKHDQRNKTRATAQGQSHEVTQPVPEYEATQQATSVTPFPSPGDASQYQELDRLPSDGPPKGLGPTYEPLRANSRI